MKVSQIVILEKDIDKWLGKNVLQNYPPVSFLEIQGREKQVIFKINGSESMRLGPSGIYSLDLLGTNGYIQSLSFSQIDERMTSSYGDNPIAIIINILSEEVGL